MEDYCATIDKGTYDSFIKEIIRDFEDLHTGKLRNDLKLLNYYKGVPISYGANILEVDKEVLVVSAHETQLAVLENDMRTLMKSSHFRKDIIADVMSIDWRTEIVILRNFIYTDILSEKRSAVRVDLDDPTPVIVSYEEGKETIGRLNDLSVEGLALLMPDDCVIDPETKVNLNIRLPIIGQQGFHDLTIEAVFLKTIQTSQHLKHIFMISLDRRSENLFCHFISQRQLELVKELKEICRR